MMKMILEWHRSVHSYVTHHGIWINPSTKQQKNEARTCAQKRKLSAQSIDVNAISVGQLAPSPRRSRLPLDFLPSFLRAIWQTCP